MKLQAGMKVTNAITLRNKDHLNDDWEPFNKGVFRNRFTNALKARHDIHDFVIYGHVFAPGTLVGTLTYEDELAAPGAPPVWNIDWRTAEGYPVSGTFLTHRGWYTECEFTVLAAESSSTKNV